MNAKSIFPLLFSILLLMSGCKLFKSNCDCPKFTLNPVVEKKDTAIIDAPQPDNFEIKTSH